MLRWLRCLLYGHDWHLLSSCACAPTMVAATLHDLTDSQRQQVYGFTAVRRECEHCHRQSEKRFTGLHLPKPVADREMEELRRMTGL